MDDRTLTERVSHIETVLGPLLEEFPTSGCDTIAAQIVRPGEKVFACAGEAANSKFAVEEIISRVQNAIDRIMRQSYKLQEIGDRVMGTLPEGAGEATKTLEPNGSLERLFLTLDYLDGSISRLEQVGLRLERI